MRPTNTPYTLDKKISLLVPGDEVIVLKGEGFPPVPRETATVVWKVDGVTALTASGTILTSGNISDLIVTGRSFETYFVSAEALHTWGQMVAAQKEAKDGQEPDWTAGTFPTEPE